MTKQGAARAYYELTKPGIIYGNVLVAAAGFMYASRGITDWRLFAATLLGLACVIASACVFNNYYDRDIDAKMERTRSRALANGTISNRAALLFCALLLAAGVLLLFFLSSVLALCIALAGFVIYTACYTPLKHLSPYTLFVGALAGATPPVVGYVAVMGALDYPAALLFAFLFVWQLPHFLAIAVYRGDEYAAADIPLFMKGPYTKGQKKFARGVFYASLVVLLAWCAVLFVI